jgi:hypothetical protein
MMETIGTRCIDMNAITLAQVLTVCLCPPPTKPRRHPVLCAR